MLDTCPLAGSCGGCMYQGVPYEQQLKEKEQFVRDCMAEAGLDASLVQEIKACPDIYNYRNKMEYSFGDEVKGGPLQLGLHKKGAFFSILTTDHCQIVPEDFNRIVRLTLDFCTEKGYTHYNKKSHKGLLRSLILRWGVRTKQILVNIVTSSESEFAGMEFAHRITEHSSEFDNQICCVMQTFNDSVSDALRVDDVQLLYGEPYYFEQVLGLQFKVGPFSFFQTNVPAAERLYSDALALIPGIEGKNVYDLYCGTGTITQAMALKANTAVGVEIVEEAVEAAKVNAAINGLDNCYFIAGDVGKVLSTIPVKPDVIVVDPPRSGITPKSLKQILEYGVENVLYISCNPKTLAENLRGARLYGYSVGPVQPYDNFPFTKYIETIVLLQK
ncbi:MAG: 23S rRNA (uracil(1939)-C(5))-methyltransferase RlmD, partial [Firmicutes bacterium]|nr:23S rRNA (uracil(1939)-C(5))-methyltransferase RlmD [Bacillota bacterium]